MNKYVDFISDKHFLKCIENVHISYLRAKVDISKKKFNKNKIDIIKLSFDSKFNNISEESLIELEFSKQINIAINNSIGNFHKQILYGIKGFEIGDLNGFDLISEDNTLFADFHLIPLPKKYEEFSFQKLADIANIFKSAMCYSVSFWPENSFNEKFIVINNESSVSHKRVFRISGDQFYALLSGQEDALIKLYKALPKAISYYLKSIEKN